MSTECTVMSYAQAEVMAFGSRSGYPETRVPPLVWRESEVDEEYPEADARRLLRANLNIMGVGFIAYAYRVREVDGLMEFDGEDGRIDGDEIDTFYAAFSLEGHVDTIEIDGARYAVFICPQCG